MLVQFRQYIWKRIFHEVHILPSFAIHFVTNKMGAEHREVSISLS